MAFRLKQLLAHLAADAELDEAEVRRMLCAWLGCATSSATAPSAAPESPPTPSASPAPACTPSRLPDAWGFTSPAVIPFDLSLTVPVTLIGPDGKSATTAMLMDSGASVTLLNGALGETLGLPNLGTDNVTGVGGSAAAYWSEATLELGGRTFTAQRVVVDPQFTSAPPLLSMRWLIDNNLGLALMPKSLQVWFFTDAGPSGGAQATLGG